MELGLLEHPHLEDEHGVSMIDEYDDDDRRPAGRRPGEMPGSPRAALRKRSPNRQTETKSRKERSYELFGLTALKPEVKKKQPRDGKSMVRAKENLRQTCMCLLP